MAPEIGLRGAAALLAVMAFTGFNPKAVADTMYWDPAGAGGGAGTWDAGSANWLDNDTGSPVVYPNTTTTGAYFQGTAGAVTLGGGLTIDANAITLATSGYDIVVPVTIAGTGITNLDLTGVAPVINLATTLTGTIAGDIAGTAGFTLAGGGNLTLNTTNAAATVNGFTDGTNLLTLPGGTTGLYVGEGVSGTGIASGNVISAINSGAGTVTLSGTASATETSENVTFTSIDQWTTNAVVNGGSTLTVDSPQQATAGFVLNNGATFTGNQGLASTNDIYINSGASTITPSTLNELFYGNGNISNWNEGYTTVTGGSSSLTGVFSNFGGTVTWSTGSTATIRIVQATGGGNTFAPFANFDFGTGSAGLDTRDGTSYLYYGGVQSEGTASNVGNNTNGGGHDDVVVIGSANLSETYEGQFGNGDGTGASFVKTGFGTLTYSGTSAAAETSFFSVPADINVAGGTLNATYSNFFTNIFVPTNTAEIAQGGTLKFTGDASASQASLQNLGNLTVGSGGGDLVINPNGGSSGGATTTVNFGAITDTVAGSNLGIKETSSQATLTTTTNKGADGTYGGRIIFTDASGNINFTTTASGASPYTLSGYTGYGTFSGNGDTSSTDYLLNDNGTLAGADSVNLLKITDDTTAQALSMGGNTLTITAGGLLFTGANAYSIGSSIGDGNIASGTATNSDLLLQQYGTGALTINSAIINGVGASTLTVAGTGPVILANTNTYTGATFLTNGSTTEIGSNAALGAQGTGAQLNMDGGTLVSTGAVGLYNGSIGTNNRAIVLGGDGGALDATGGNSLTVAGVVSDTTLAGVNNNVINTYGALTVNNGGNTGTVTLANAADTYTGATIIDGGVLSVTLLANGGVASSIGAAVSTANALIINGGTLQYGSTATTASTTNRTFTVGTGGATLDASGPSGDSVTFSNTSPVWYTASGSRTLTLQGSNTNANTLAAAITDPSYVNSGLTGSTSVSKTGAGFWDLTGANTYSGGTTISAGTLQLGTGDSTALGTGGLAVNGGTLDLDANVVTTGSFGGSSSGAIITSSIAGTAGLTVQQGGATNTYAGIIQNGSATGGLSFATAGTGKTILTNANTYTGATTVGAGTTLDLASGGGLANTAVAVNGTLLANASNGGIGGTVTLNSSSVLSQQDSSIGSLSLGGLNVNGSSTISFDLQDTGTLTGDTITISSAATGANSLFISIDALAGATAQPASGTIFQLITDTAGGLNLQTLSYTPDITIDSQAYDLTVASTGTSDYVTLTKASLNYYWTGGNNSSWTSGGNTNLANFTKANNVGSANQTANLGATSNVFLTADSAANYTQTLDASYSINSLTFTGTSAVSTVGPNQTGAENNVVSLAAGTGGGSTVLTIDAAAGFSDADGVNYSGVGIEVQNGNAGATISANVALGGSQAWEVDSANGLTVSGTVSGLAAATLSKTGTGTLTLSAANTYAGNTVVSAGTLALGAGGQIGSTGVLTVSGGTLDLASNNQTVGGLNDGGFSAGTVTSSVGTTGTLTINDTLTTAGTYSGAIKDNGATGSGGVALVLAGPGTETISGSNNFSGGTTVTGGSLIAANNYALGNPSSTNANDGLSINNTAGTSTVYFTSATPQLAALSGGSSGGTSNVVLGNTASGGSATNLTIGGGGATTVFNGNISDLKISNSAAIGSLTIVGGSLQLGGVDSFNGGTLLSGGTLILANAAALENSTLTDNSGGGTLEFGSTTTATTLGGLAGSANIALTNLGAGNVALTIGNNSTNQIYSGALSGGGSLIIAGGNYTLSGLETYTGTTTVNAGNSTVTSTGGIGNAVSQAGSVTINGGSLAFNGSELYTPSISINGGGNASVTGAGATISDSGALNIDTNNPNNTNASLAIFGGTVTVNSVLIGRGGDNFSTGAPTAGSTTEGLYVDGGNMTVNTTLDIGSGAGQDNSSVSTRIDAGSLTVGGITNVTNNAAGRYSIFDLSGGTFTDNDTSGVGILVGGNANTGLDAELLIRGTAIVNTPAITLGNANESGGLINFDDYGGTLNITGTNGIVDGAPAATATVTGTLGLASSAVAPTLVASGTSWSSSFGFTLVNSTTAGAPVFETSAGDNITLTGALEGTGGLVAAGSGILTLASTGNGYSGVTSITGGILNINSEYALGGADYTGLIINGGTLQYAATLLNATTDVSTSAVTFGANGATIDTNGNNISFADSVGNGGAGSFTKAGLGTLTLAGGASYNGNTTVSAGTLIVGGAVSGAGTSASVAANATMEVDSTFENAAAIAVSGKLDGSGGNIGAATITGAGATLAPGLTTANTGVVTGALTANGNISLTSDATFSIRIGLTMAGIDSDALVMGSGAFTTDGSAVLQLADTSNVYNAPIGALYMIILGGDSTSNLFSNASEGQIITTSLGDQFQVFYEAGNSLSTLALGDGSNVDLELVAVPEPGTWASLIGGIGMLVVWQRSRRRRA